MRISKHSRRFDFSTANNYQAQKKYKKSSDGLPTIKTTLLYFYWLRDVWKKTKPDRIVNIDKEKIWN
jgi:hypothetical protein